MCRQRAEISEPPAKCEVTFFRHATRRDWRSWGSVLAWLLHRYSPLGRHVKLPPQPASPLTRTRRSPSLCLKRRQKISRSLEWHSASFCARLCCYGDVLILMVLKKKKKISSEYACYLNFSSCSLLLKELRDIKRKRKNAFENALQPLWLF